MRQISTNIFIGVDGGGTKSKVRVEDEAGKLLGEALSGPSNIRFSIAKAWQSIIDGVGKAFQQAGLELNDPNYKLHLSLGLAGCEVKLAMQEFLACSPHLFASLLLNKDSYTACIGAHSGQDGAIIIIGTGVSAVQIAVGQTIQISGYGFPHDDKGGGAWLGLKAVGLTFEWLDGRLTKASPLLEQIFARFNNNLDDFINWANVATATQFAEVAPLVLDMVKVKDEYAVHLIKRAARAIDKINSALELRSPGALLPVSLFGGIAPFIEPWLGNQLQARLKERDHDANWGAIYLLRKQLNIVG